jgi:hypothetical protein
MKRVYVLLAALALVVLATVGHSVARAASPSAHACCAGGGCCDVGPCCR